MTQMSRKAVRIMTNTAERAVNALKARPDVTLYAGSVRVPDGWREVSAPTLRAVRRCQKNAESIFYAGYRFPVPLLENILAFCYKPKAYISPQFNWGEYGILFTNKYCSILYKEDFKK